MTRPAPETPTSGDGGMKGGNSSGWEVTGYEGDVIVNGQWEAGATAESLCDVEREIGHYAVMYAPDGKVETRIWETGRRPAEIPSPQSEPQASASAPATDAPLPWLPDREEIARVIDGERWSFWDTYLAGFPDQTVHTSDSYCGASLRKADSILALLSRPSEGGTVSVDESGSSPAAPVKSEGQSQSEGDRG